MRIGEFTATTLTNKTRPICIKKDALGPMRPFEDLYVSPGHSIMTPQGFKNASKLINKNTIFRDMSCQEITYYHIELSEHSKIVANGIESESYRDDHNRHSFSKAPQKAL